MSRSLKSGEFMEIYCRGTAQIVALVVENTNSTYKVSNPSCASRANDAQRSLKYAG